MEWPGGQPLALYSSKVHFRPAWRGALPPTHAAAPGFGSGPAWAPLASAVPIYALWAVGSAEAWRRSPSTADTQGVRGVVCHGADRRRTIRPLPRGLMRSPALPCPTAGVLQGQRDGGSHGR